jgi:hypothetical protein
MNRKDILQQRLKWQAGEAGEGRAKWLQFDGLGTRRHGAISSY